MFPGRAAIVGVALIASLGAVGTAEGSPEPHIGSIGGYVRVCGGPSPGRCFIGGLQSCVQPRGCVTTRNVVLLHGHRVVQTAKLRHARFKLEAVPAGDYVIKLESGGRHVRHTVFQEKHLVVRAHRRTRVVFTLAAR